MATKNLYGTVSESGDGHDQSASFTRLEDHGVAELQWGRSAAFDAVSVPYDLMNAKRSDEVPFKVSANRLMTQEEALKRLEGLMVRVGCSGMDDATQYAFHRSICVADALNSASLAQPDRSEIVVHGGPPINFHDDVLVPLGNDARRFFRAYADFTRTTLKAIRAEYNTGSEEAYRRWHETIKTLDWIAEEKGMQRFPDLVFDAADACSNLTMQERHAVNQSKAITFTAGTNVVDAVVTNRVKSDQPKAMNYNPAVSGGGNGGGNIYEG